MPTGLEDRHRGGLAVVLPQLQSVAANTFVRFARIFFPICLMDTKRHGCDRREFE